MRFLPYALSIVFAALAALAAATIAMPWCWVLLAVFGALALLGTYDVLQTRHSILRNYPLLGHLRFLQEMIAPELHQYYIESNTDGAPFSRDQRALVYRRSKDLEGLKPFGTERDVYGDEYEWLAHSIAPRPKATEPLRTEVGGPDCTRPYSCSLLNISAMSFGALGAHAILALNEGARRGGFFHCTGEGGFSPYHKKPGGDVVWQIGTGYFGCRTKDGGFDPDRFRDQARNDQVKMIEIKLSQGAKPGHGGVLPAAKVDPEIAETRGVPQGEDCISPPGHSAFGTPRELCEYIARLRELSDGRPIGFKLCIGERREFLGICKAMLETGILPDFITVDGGEGGTGAAPLEFSDSMGTPLVDALVFVHNALVGCDLRDKVRVAASGKAVSAFNIVRNLAIGADWCNSARGFMMALGCIQAQSCHTNECPVGVATQDPLRQRALDVGLKSARVHQFHRNTMDAVAEIVAATGLDHPDQLEPRQVWMRKDRYQVVSYADAYHYIERGQLLERAAPPSFARPWGEASADTFRG